MQVQADRHPESRARDPADADSDVGREVEACAALRTEREKRQRKRLINNRGAKKKKKRKV